MPIGCEVIRLVHLYDEIEAALIAFFFCLDEMMNMLCAPFCGSVGEEDEIISFQGDSFHLDKSLFSKSGLIINI